MLDIQYIRDNRELVQKNAEHKNIKVDIEELLSLDERRRQLVTEIESLRAERNELSSSMKNAKPSQELIEKGRELKDRIAALEQQLTPIENNLNELHKQVPNVSYEDVPVGETEDENIVAKEWGDRPVFDFEPKSHWEIAESRDLIDKERAAKVAGSRFAYLKGGLVELQFAIIQFTIQSLGNEALLKRLIEENQLSLSPKPFTPVLPPAMIKTQVFDAMDRLEPREDRYRVGEESDDLWLQGSAEHTLGSMYKDEILAEDMFPIRYLGYSSSFRREAGTYGKDTEGIIRMHQFDKLEMEVFSTPETGLEEHYLAVAIQEHLVQQLGLPYRLMQKCTADIGKPNARGIDIDVWMPGQEKYRETHTADYMTDYQARRLMTRVRRPDGSTDLVHTNDATAFALGRIMVAIMENNQTAEGLIRIPKVLQPFIGGKEQI
jgi:seryl-tRNA synthetase